jgi:hypothetical protein
MSNFDDLKRDVERGKLGEQAKKLQQSQIDIARMFNKVFSCPEGQKVLEHLDDYSHKNFPNYEHQNAVLCTYSKIGEQTLVKYIRAMIKLSKKE